MKTKAVRLYGKEDIRLEEFDLPEIKDDEILASVISDSVCMSTFKAVEQGASHKRVPNNCAEVPTIIGHEFCGLIVKVGKKWQDTYKVGQKYAIQPAMSDGNVTAPGYSYPYFGGNSQYIIIPNNYIECGNVLIHEGDCFFSASLAEPVSCVIAGFHENFHTDYEHHAHIMGIKEGGTVAILAGAGPMGLGAADYGIHGPRKPRMIVVTDIDDARLARAAELLTVEDAAKCGVALHYVNTATCGDAVAYLKELTGGEGFDDVFVYAPVTPVVEQADAILASGGCLNFFAGPLQHDFSAKVNFYEVHYGFHRITGTSGGNTADMIEAVDLISRGVINPSMMVTHVGGLDSVIPTVLNLPNIKGAKKLVYNGISMPMTAIADFEKLGEEDPMYKELDRICKANNGLWSAEAEKYLLENCKKI